MTSVQGLLIGTGFGVLVTLWLGIGVHVLRDFSYHQLERYCRERSRLSFFDIVLDRCERYALAAEVLRMLAVATTMMLASVWLFESGGPDPYDWRRLMLFASAALLTILLVTLWIPCEVARHGAAPLIWYSWRFWQAATIVATPFLWTLDLFDVFGRRLSGHAEQDEDEIDEEALEEDILSVVTAGARDGLLEQQTRDMIESVLELDDVNVSTIMTRRSDIDALEVETEWSEVVKFVNQFGRTRIPVYRKTMDDIVGILYAKDLLTSLDDGQERNASNFSLEQIVRSKWQVVQTKPLDELLREFRGTRSHLAIVVDEFESTVGIVSIEDVLEQIVGDIQDETDLEEEEDIVHVDDDVVVVSGDMHVDELNERLGLGLPEGEEYDSLGGLMIFRLGEIPNASTTLTVGQARLVVVSANARRVERIRIELLGGETTRPESDSVRAVSESPTMIAKDPTSSATDIPRV